MLSTGASSGSAESINGGTSTCQVVEGETVAVTEGVTEHPRPRRADAQRNRDRLLAAATAAFAEQGEDVALETIAARAGVGIGTLYRHFPNRDALVAAAYRHEVDALCVAA